MSNSSLVKYTQLSPYHSGKRKFPLTRITIHCIVGQWNTKQAGDFFYKRPAGKECSCNYAVCTDGIALIVDEANRSWCSSSSDNDNRAITIETASNTSHPYKVKDDVFNNLIELLVDICKRNGKSRLVWFGDKEKTLAYTPKDDELVLTVHRWFANKSCPGDYLYNKHNEIVQKVNERIGGCEEMGCPYWKDNKCTKDEKKETSLKLLDKVKLTEDATVYGKAQRYASWVYSKELYVREIKGDRIVVSTLKEGAITGPVHIKHLRKV